MDIYQKWYDAYMKEFLLLPDKLLNLRLSQEGLRKGFQERLEAISPDIQGLDIEEFRVGASRSPEGSAMHTYKKLKDEIWNAYDPRTEIADCRSGVLYRVLCRNSNCGIWVPENQSFLIARTKFDRSYLFEELHWDSCSSYGTARPYEVLQEPPVFEKEGECLEYLLEWRSKLGAY